MLKLIIWFFAIYIIYKLVKFFNRVSNAINRASQNTPAAQPPTQIKNPENIIDADFVEIDSKINNKEELK